MPRSQSRKNRSQSRSRCRRHQIRNPISNRCVKRSGRLGRKILRQKSLRRDCSPNQIRNPKSGRCVKRDGVIGQRILSSPVRLQRSREIDSQRMSYVPIFSTSASSRSPRVKQEEGISIFPKMNRAPPMANVIQVEQEVPEPDVPAPLLSLLKARKQLRQSPGPSEPEELPKVIPCKNEDTECFIYYVSQGYLSPRDGALKLKNRHGEQSNPVMENFLEAIQTFTLNEASDAYPEAEGYYRIDKYINALAGEESSLEAVKEILEVDPELNAIYVQLQSARIPDQLKDGKIVFKSTPHTGFVLRT